MERRTHPGGPGAGHTAGRAAPEPAPYEFVRAPRRLGALVPSTVGYRAAEEQPRLHRGLPSPYLTLVFSLDGPVVCGETPEHARGPDAYRAGVLFGGLHRTPAYIAQPARQSGVQLALHPLAARALLGMPAAELNLTAVDGAALLGRGAAELLERLQEQPEWEERFALLTGYLRDRVDRAARRPGVRPGVRAEVAEAWRWLARSGGAGPVDALARHVALSPRQLGALFRREVGMAPKQIAGLMRFERARGTIAASVAQGRPPDLADTAARCGFYDHSHLVRDFHRYTGLSPSGWIAEEHRNIQAGGHRNGEEWAP
ncbi:helix-turn-helix domain-containing protein [Streptomyces sp. JJ36]|uniref:AraC family transcriptional regulator n=1 Tax=Streptomyces sp. JJ36 TaxID=2736645 RepID=UPI001F23FD3A|nr:helix-turn-helix domain-containing protein [Streptomyces sp. JJ36]MCF6524286.1 AraC family transcriptional regulator [Streptomyces sp. JJ36]